MDPEVLYLFANVLFTVGGWQLGKRIWASKRADPGRGKWYGAILGFLLGFIGILTLLGISWYWHPASEPLESQGRRRSTRRVGNARTVVLAITGAAALAAVLITAFFLFDSQRYAGWAVGMSDTGTPISRAACAQVTVDWDTCFVQGAVRRTDSEWKAEWERQSQDGLLRAGVGALVTLASVSGFIYAVRRQPVVTTAASPTRSIPNASGETLDRPLPFERVDGPDPRGSATGTRKAKPGAHSTTL